MSKLCIYTSYGDYLAISLVLPTLHPVSIYIWLSHRRNCRFRHVRFFGIGKQ